MKPNVRMLRTIAILAVIGLAGLVAVTPTAAIGLIGGPVAVSLVEPAQYVDNYSTGYSPYRRACPYAHHWVCGYDYSGYRRCGCQSNSIFAPEAGQIYGPTPWPGYGLSAPAPSLLDPY